MTQTELNRTASMVSRSERRSAEVGRGQPSVLHLLPFSNNDAGEDTSHATQSTPTEPRVFPVLAVTRSPSVSSKSQSFAPDTFTKFKTKNLSLNQRKRSSRVSSERSSGRQVGKNVDVISRPRAKSEYDLYLDRQVSTATFYMNEDANLKTGDNSPRHHDSPLEKELATNNSTSRRRTAYNSLMNITNMQKQGQVISFWYKKKIDRVESRNKSQAADSSRVTALPSNMGFKLNVKELPRSKTPIVDNDPDKLNMNTVIAFLQTTDTEDTRTSVKRNDSKNTGVRIVQRRIAYDQVSAHQKRQAASDVHTPHTAETSRQIAEADKVNQVHDDQGNDDIARHRFPDFRPQSYPSYRMDKIKKNVMDRRQDGVNHRARKSQYSDLKTYNSIVSTQSEPKKRPKSLHWRVPADQQEGIDISTMISNINNDTSVNNNTTRPFRLHRFLTIVPDKLPDVETTKSGPGEDRFNSVTSGTWVSYGNSGSPRSKFGGRIDHVNVSLDNQDTGSHPDLQVNRSTQETARLTTAVHLMSVKKGLKSSGTQMDKPDELSLRSRKTTVICLPSAEYEADEEVALSREITRVSLKEPTLTQIHSQSDDLRPKSSFLDTINIKNIHAEDKEHYERQKFSSSHSNNQEKLSKPDTVYCEMKKSNSSTSNDQKKLSKLDTEQDSISFQIGDLAAKPAAGHYLRQDVSIPPSYFLSYPTTGVSLQSLHGDISPSLHSSNDYRRQNSHVLPCHPFLQTSSNSQEAFARNQVKLTLRKERDKASALTYMSDMEISCYDMGAS
ncbi:hypothetical protein Btru_001780 [Bulinus truncatus]|nr:hypothetical protein Btru_001780 [Bulinus truncatus]